MVTATPGFLGDAEDLSSGPHAPVMTTLPIEPSPLPSDVVLKKDSMALPITINFSARYSAQNGKYYVKTDGVSWKKF